MKTLLDAPKYSDGIQVNLNQNEFNPVENPVILNEILTKLTWVSLDFHLKKDASKEENQFILKELPRNYQIYNEKIQLSDDEKCVLEVAIVGHPR